MREKIARFCFGIVVLLSGADAFAREFTLERQVQDELLVRFKPNVKSSVRDQVSGVAQSIVMGTVGRTGYTRVKVVGRKSLMATEAIYLRDPSVESVQPNFIYRASAAPSDPLYADQWAFKNTGQTVSQPADAPDAPVSANPVAGADMNLEPAWDIHSNCASVKVAVVDTGINSAHEDLQGNIWNGTAVGYPNGGANFVGGISPPGTNPTDVNGHGTHVSTIIGAKAGNAKGGVGVCHSATIMGIRALDATGIGTTADIAAGIAFALDKGAKIINMSLGGPSQDAALQGAITDAQTRGAIVVTASGNEAVSNETSPTYPCAFTNSNLICVASVSQDGNLSDYSNYGTTSVDVAAPGENIVSGWFGSSQYVSDSLSAGWSFPSSGGSAWNYGSASLVMPSNYDGTSAKYLAATNASAYKEFTVASASGVVLEATAIIDVARNDAYQTAFKVGSGGAGTAGNPYSSGGVLVDQLSGSSGGTLYSASYDASECSGKTCSFGFRLLSQASSAGELGIEMLDVSVVRKTQTANSYNVLRGTSMAAPHVAGLAALIWSYNPNYTAADVVEAVTRGGRAIASLSGKIKTGRTADALLALRYVRAPSGLKVR